MRKVISFILTTICTFCSFFGISLVQSVEPTPIENRVYSDEEISVSPDTNSFLNVTVLDEGMDIYTPTEGSGAGYRYGPTVFSNADGSIDIFFAAPGICGQWDWITYKHSPDGGTTWTDEKKVLGPTAGSEDAYSTCDPGVVKFGDYWYIGYTSTADSRGLFNHVYVARSKNINGPYEKWNGSGWGGNPKAIITFNGNADAWGAGEPSFIFLNEKLYIYYTWKDTAEDGSIVNETRVAVADAQDENWPLTIEKAGTAIKHPDSSCDSADVKYIEDYGKFIAVSTSQRFSEDSSLSVYESNDGYSFKKVNDLKTNIAHCCHNSGISSRTNGHIRLDDKKYICYAYGSDWGNWSTRLNEISIGLVESPDFSDSSNPNNKMEINYAKLPLVEKFVGICDSGHVYECSKGKPVYVKVNKLSESYRGSMILFGVKFYGYDKSVIRMAGNFIIPINEGRTTVTAEWLGMTTEFIVYVS